MSLYQQGSSVDVTGLSNVNPKELQVGGEYIWQYWVSATTFMFITPDQINSVINTLLNLKAYMSKIDPNEIDPPITITGVAIDTDNGNIWLRGIINPSSRDPNAPLEAGFNPWVVAGVIGGVLATIGAAVLLRGVYQVVAYTLGIQTTTPGGPPALDPCNNPGVINYFKCLGQESKWLLIGALLGILFIVVLVVVKFGADEL